MSAPATLDLVIYQGATFSKVVTWKTGDPAAPVDLTGYTARMQVRKSVAATDILLSLTTENGGITLGDEEGTIELSISATQTAGLTFKAGVYDLELVSGSNVRRLLKGSITVDPEITR